MAPNPRVIKAFDFMKALGISDKEVKPVLIKLLKIYEGNWELIEDDNYRTLVDAYFDYENDKVPLNSSFSVYLKVKEFNLVCIVSVKKFTHLTNLKSCMTLK